MRTRDWPLVPAKFEDLVPGPREDNVAWIRERCNFVPNLDLRDCIWEISLKRRKEILIKAKTLSEYALRNLSDKVSEDRWDHDAESQVFGSIRNDKRLRVEKKQCYYLLEGKRLSARVKGRRPDQTFGLASYEDNNTTDQATKGLHSRCFNTGASSAETDFPNALFKSRLLNQVYCNSTGLIVDGLWGDVDLIFPWGVYEAKKTSQGYDAVKKQVIRAARIYLGMLDDLARSPDNVDEYQKPDSSSRYQVFLFTSCGPRWEVWIACNYCGQGMVDRIWSGNICDENKAYDLLCIMEQIHEYAVNNHRNFVVEHLQAWLQRAELDACLGDVRTWTRDKLLKYEKYPKGCYPPEWLKKLHESKLVSHGKPETPKTPDTPETPEKHRMLSSFAGISKPSLRKGKLRNDRHKRLRRYLSTFKEHAADESHSPACRTQ